MMTRPIARRAYLLSVILFTLPALSPLLQPTIPDSADGRLHLYRALALDAAWHAGVIFPRWLPDLAFGYGMPLFVFYAPFSYYPTTLLYELLGDVRLAFNASTALAMLLGAIGMYRLMTSHFDERAGLLASVAYTYAPYTLLTAYARGSLPIVWAWGVIPWVFWAFGRLHRQPTRLNLAMSALLCGVALLTHNISNLLFLPALGLYVVVLTVARRGKPSWLPLRLAIFALTLALGLATFFLMPALLEREFVQIERVITPPDFDYRSNFLAWDDLLALPESANTGLLNPTHHPMLGWPQMVLATLALLMVALRQTQSAPPSGELWAKTSAPRLPPTAYLMATAKAIARRPVTIFASLTLVGTIFMTLPISVRVWDSLPLLAFIQQPQRLLSLAAFCLAILSGSLVAHLPKRVSHTVTLLGTVGIIGFAAPLLYPRYANLSADALTFTGMMTYEQSIGAIGTTSFGEYLPIWVRDIPTEPDLTDPKGFRNPSGLSIERKFNQLDLTLSAPQPYHVELPIFYFPGWRATLNGQPISVTPSEGRGLISFTIPSGEHHLRLRFTDTPVRWWANAISLLSLGVVGLIILSTTAKTITRNFPVYRLPPTAYQLPPTVYLVLPIILLLTKTLYLDHADTPLKRVFEGQTVAQAAVDTDLNFGGQLTLLGYTLRNATVQPGDSFDLTAYWQLGAGFNGNNYSILAHLVDEAGNLYASQDNLHPGNFPMNRWQAWGYAQDPHRVPVPLGLPAGEYRLVIGAYHPETWQRLPILSDESSNLGNVLPISVRVAPPSRQPTRDELDIHWPQQVELVDGLTLLGATPEREFMSRNDFLRVALFWEVTSTAATLPDYRIKLRLISEKGEVTVSQTGRPSHGRYPTPQWSAGERVRDNQALWLTADVPLGVYRLEVALWEGAHSVSKRVDLGAIEVVE